MKIKYLAGVMLLMAGLCSLSSCSDDDYSAATGNVISTIETGDAEVVKVFIALQRDAYAGTIGLFNNLGHTACRYGP